MYLDGTNTDQTQTQTWKRILTFQSVKSAARWRTHESLGEQIAKQTKKAWLNVRCALCLCACILNFHRETEMLYSSSYILSASVVK